MVTGYYLDGPLAGKTQSGYDSITGDWETRCEHITGDEREGWFAISKPVRDPSGFNGYVYTHVECEACARRMGLLW